MLSLLLDAVNPILHTVVMNVFSLRAHIFWGG